MRLLNIVDQLFLLFENRKQSMHVGGLFLFELPDNADPDFVYKLVNQMQNSEVPPTFPFNQVLHNQLFWKEDEDFDVEHHLLHIALPKPARIRELLAYISKEHGRLLDRARPLWECHIIEGIEPEAEGRNKRFGLYFKVHHSLLDGVAAMQLVQKSLSHSPNEMHTLPIWSLMLKHRNQVDALIPKGRSITKIVNEQFNTIKPVLNEVKQSVLDRNKPGFVTTTQAPACILNQRISSSRRFAAESFDSSRFKRISKSLSVTINDVVLAICSGALRSYLISLQDLPMDPLIAFVPVSLREDESIAGNQLSFLLCDLGTHLDSPLQRLKTVQQSMNDGKDRFARLTQAQTINYSAITYAWEGLNLVTGAFPKKQAFNLLISNVPGSTKPLYWNGAKLTSLYPASVLFDGQALNITLASYLDTIEFGIIACSKTLPKIQSILTFLDEELTLLEKICDEKEAGVRE